LYLGVISGGMAVIKKDLGGMRVRINVLGGMTVIRTAVVFHRLTTNQYNLLIKPRITHEVLIND
jgi:hypothetical protein